MDEITGFWRNVYLIFFLIPLNVVRKINPRIN